MIERLEGRELTASIFVELDVPKQRPDWRAGTKFEITVTALEAVDDLELCYSSNGRDSSAHSLFGRGIVGTPPRAFVTGPAIIDFGQVRAGEVVTATVWDANHSTVAKVHAVERSRPSTTFEPSRSCGDLLATEQVFAHKLADINFDARVDFDDFLILAANYGGLDAFEYEQGNLDGDYDVDFDDFLILAGQFGR